jgi:hypothetical protein
LIDAGFVERQSHRGRGGEFASSTYVVLLDEATGIVRSGGPSCPTAPVSGSRYRVRAPSALDDQLGSQRQSPRRPTARPRSSRRRERLVVQGGLFESEDGR